MRQRLLFAALLALSIEAFAQSRQDLAGEWKNYASDKSTFDYLRLNKDGTGVKCFGRTINGRDTLFAQHHSAIYISGWTVKKNTLLLQAKSDVNFALKPDYKVTLKDGQLTLEGEHLMLSIYPSHLNRDMFQRSVTYKKANQLKDGYGTPSTVCIVRERNLFVFQPQDSIYQLANYKGNADLIPGIVACHPDYEYIQTYPDPPYSLLIPKNIRRWTFGFGNKDFYLRFDLNDTEKSDVTIVIYYDFDNTMRDRFFDEIKEGKEKKDIVRRNGREIYKSINWQEKFEGKVFLPNSIVIAYYTSNREMEPLLQECIASFRYN